MRPSILRFSWLGLVLVSACSDPEPPPPACAEYKVPASTDLTAPAVSFKNDVVPILTQSCAFESCHGRENGPSAGLAIRVDPKLSPEANASRIRGGFVGVASTSLTSSPLVAAGNPRGSWLMRKLDGDHCLSQASCASGDCGQAMPRTGQLLSVANRDTIRRWIAQGAKDD